MYLNIFSLNLIGLISAVLRIYAQRKSLLIKIENLNMILMKVKYIFVDYQILSFIDLINTFITCDATIS